jgi:hypothetical protein
MSTGRDDDPNKAIMQKGGIYRPEDSGMSCSRVANPGQTTDQP